MAAITLAAVALVLVVILGLRLQALKREVDAMRRSTPTVHEDADEDLPEYLRARNAYRKRSGA